MAEIKFADQIPGRTSPRLTYCLVNQDFLGLFPILKAETALYLHQMISKITQEMVAAPCFYENKDNLFNKYLLTIWVKSYARQCAPTCLVGCNCKILKCHTIPLLWDEMSIQSSEVCLPSASKGIWIIQQVAAGKQLFLSWFARGRRQR